MSRLQTIRLTDKFQYAAFDGSKPLPVNVEVFDTLTKNSLPQKILHISNLEPELQELVARIRQYSLNADNMPFREAGAKGSYSNGKLLYRPITSDLPHQILAKDLDMALKQSGILDRIDDGDIPKEIIDIHTHAGREYYPLKHQLMSRVDFSGYRSLAEFYSHYAGQDIPVRGIVIPVSEINNDVYIEATDNNLCPVNDGKLEKIAKMVKQERKTPGIHPPACPLTISCLPDP